MRAALITPKRAPAAVLCAVAGLVLSLAIARPAGAFDDHGSDDWGSGWDDYNWSQERMHNASLASQEEMAREAGREKRREEVAKEKAQKSEEAEAYYAAIMQASKVSLGAPRGAYYRKPGFTSADAPPADSPVVAAGQFSLIYDQGIYWLARGAEYVVVIPSPGVVVKTLPAEGVRVIPTKGGTLFYHFGVFYQSKDGAYEVVKPPAGTVVGYLPDGYTQEAAKDGTVFKFGGLSFRQVFLQGVLAYQVV
jgi:hypothetical protein